jgi:hypothetical protein
LARKASIQTASVLWALCLLTAAAVLILGPLYLVADVPRALGGAEYDFLAPSYGWSREILVAAHLVFVIVMVVYGMFPGDRALLGRMTGVSVLLGLVEVLLALGAVFLGESARFAPPHMAVLAAGLLLVLGGVGLSLDTFLRRLVSPKAPVVLIFGVGLIVGAVGFGAVGALNVRHYARIDYTRAGRYSLPPATEDLLSSIDKTVEVTTLFVVRSPADDTLRREATDILEEYARRSDRVEVHHIDLRRDVKAITEFSKRLVKKELVKGLRRQGIKLTGRHVDAFAGWMARKGGRIDREGLDELKEWLTARGIEIGEAQLDELLNWLAEKVMRLEENSVVFECPRTGRAMKIASHEMLQVIPGERPTDARRPGPAGAEPQDADPEYRFLGDTVFHQALSLVTVSKVVRVYFVVGHGEKPEAIGPGGPHMNPQQFAEMARVFSIQLLEDGLKRRYYRLETLNLDEVDEGKGIPADCDVLVIAGPWMPFTVHTWGSDIQPFSKAHANLVRAYLKRGGRALVMVDPVGTESAGRIGPLLDLLKEYGVEADVEQVVWDEVLFAQPGPFGRIVWTPQARPLFTVEVVEDYVPPGAPADAEPRLHPSVRALRDWPIAVVYAAPLKVRPAPDARQARLLQSSKKSWVEPAGSDRPQGPAGKERKPRTLAVAVERATTGEPLLVVLGTSNMFIQPIIRFENSVDNEEFARKVLAWLAGHTEPPKATELGYGKVAPGTIRVVRFLSVLLIPAVFILIGAVIWLGRRT